LPRLGATFQHGTNNKLSSFARCFYWLFFSLAIVRFAGFPGPEAHADRTLRHINPVSVCWRAGQERGTAK
jgi:hypothetical protein